MKTMNKKSILEWLNSKNETKLAKNLDLYCKELEFIDIEIVDSMFYLTIGSITGPALFREMEEEVMTIESIKN